MKGYETICILHPDLTEDQVKESIDVYTKIITDDGGEVHKSDIWGLKKLAYQVKGNPRGYFVYLLYAAKSDTIRELERILRITDTNIRYMTVRVESIEETLKDKPQLLDDPTLTLQDG
ncbi:MAG: 30S ribosomal protein S6 [bacterium]